MPRPASAEQVDHAHDRRGDHEQQLHESEQEGQDHVHSRLPSSGLTSPSLRATARIASARRTNGASTILPSTVHAPIPFSPASRAAEMTLRAWAISTSVGRKTSFAIGTWLGWMALLPA